MFSAFCVVTGSQGFRLVVVGDLPRNGSGGEFASMSMAAGKWDIPSGSCKFPISPWFTLPEPSLSQSLSIASFLRLGMTVMLHTEGKSRRSHT